MASRKKATAPYASKARSNDQEQHEGVFVGNYVHEISHMLIVSALSGQHAVLLSAPGYGKTKIARSIGEQIFGDRFVFIRLEGSTPPEAVGGMIDPAAALESPPRIVYNVKGTPYDPNALAVLADETFRPNDVVFDKMLDVLDRQDVNPETAPVVWGTSNFVQKNERVEAVLDRFAMWQWVKPDPTDMYDFVFAVANRKRGQQLAVSPNSIPVPTVDDILRVRSYIPGKDTIVSISKTMSLLEEECFNKQLKTNPRRRTQWFEILYRTSAFMEGKPDFDHVHPAAAHALRWAYPSLTERDWMQWAEIASVVDDPLGAAIDTLYRDAMLEIQRVKDDTSLTKVQKAVALGDILERSRNNMSQISSSDPRIETALAEISRNFAQLAQGKDVGF